MRSLLLLAATLPLLAACATTRQPEPQTQVEVENPDKIQTTSEANKDGLSGAVTAPLRDVNLMRTKIPPVLLEAMQDPYARPQPSSCGQLTALVKPLDAALGIDLDQVPPGEDEDLMDRGRKAAGDAALGAMASAAQDLIPMRGWVRKLSGAEKHDRLVQSAMAAGAVRRAYLKGLGEARGCMPPATPQHRGDPQPEPEAKKRRFPFLGGKDAPPPPPPKPKPSVVGPTVEPIPDIHAPPAAETPEAAKGKRKPAYPITPVPAAPAPSGTPQGPSSD
ncbi:hypothetical protein [Caulobacter endophyticus]|uniref:hypothetical protein n=1 Tax=Caulobacter endophyticus TaxID=2172652 RepID=UPI001E2AC3A5|nr:hypothetical protein [Caulobacter endophyticus]